MLKEKKVQHKLVLENFWERRKDFGKLNPAMEVPVLFDEVSGKAYSDIASISELLDELNPTPAFNGSDPYHKAEVRRLTNWFNHKFYQEVTKHIIHERILSYYQPTILPDSRIIRAAQANIKPHLDYIAYLLRDRKWLAGEYISFADIAAASHLSVLDYAGDINWRYNQYAKEWYAIVKSRPSFRQLLDDRISGFNPVEHYTDLDF